MIAVQNHMLTPQVHERKAFDMPRIREIDLRALKRERSQALYDDLSSGSPTSDLVETACSELMRILDIADETTRMDLIRDTSVESLLKMVCDERARMAVEG